MTTKTGLAAALLFLTGPAWAQTADPPPELTAAIARTATAFGECVAAGVQGVGETVTPEAGAASVLSGCASQRTELLQAVEALIATRPADEQARAHERVRTQMAESEADIADAIRQRRAAATAPAQ